MITIKRTLTQAEVNNALINEALFKSDLSYNQKVYIAKSEIGRNPDGSVEVFIEIPDRDERKQLLPRNQG